MSTNTKEETTTKVVRRPMVKNIDAAIIAYYKNYIGRSDIRIIFGCKDFTAGRLKNDARDLEIEKGIITVVPHKVNSEVAYEAWNIDIKKLISNRNKLRNLGLPEEMPVEDFGAKEKAPQSGSCDA